MNQYLLPLLVFLAVMSLGGAIVAATMVRRKSFRPRLQPAKGDLDNSGGFSQMFTKVGAAAAPTEPSRGLKEYLATAGYFGAAAAPTYIGIKIVLLILGACGSTLIFLPLEMSWPVKFYLIALISAIFFFMPNMVVRYRRGARRMQVRHHLPDVVDLLEICVSAGMGLDMAWNAVADEIRTVSDVMADEMALTMLESQLGAPRTVAMRHMAERTGATELASLVALLVQTERFGTSIADALRTYANSMRQERSARAEESAEKTAVKLLFPLVFCIFPVMLIVAVGPAAVKLYQVMGGSN